MAIKRAKPAAGPGAPPPAASPAVTAADLVGARDRLVRAQLDASAILARALDECPRDPAGNTDLLAATAALGPDRAALTRDLLHRLGYAPAPAADTA